MTHDILVHPEDEAGYGGLSVTCTCGAYIMEADETVLLDVIVDAAWRHRE